MDKEFLFCVYSNTSRNGSMGLRPQVMLGERTELIGAADAELAKRGRTLEEVAGVEWIENEDGQFTPARELTPAEVWQAAKTHFADDGRLFEAFEDSAEGRRAFVAAAEAYGLADQARALVARYA